MKKIFWFIVDLFLFACAANAQTINHPIQEFSTKPGKVSRGSFLITNNQLVPISFTVETYSASFYNQKINFHPLDSGVKIELSQTSGRLGPKEVRQLDYKISCTVLPCVVSVQTAMVVGRTPQGVLIRIILPHLAYLAMSKKPRQEILMAAGLPPKK